MDTRCEATKHEIRTRLAYRNGFLCVVAERCDGRPTTEDAQALVPGQRGGRSRGADSARDVRSPEIDQKEGIYVDEEGTVFQLAEKGETKPILVEETPGESGELEQLLTASLENGKSREQERTHALLAIDGTAQETR